MHQIAQFEFKFSKFSRGAYPLPKHGMLYYLYHLSSLPLGKKKEIYLKNDERKMFPEINLKMHRIAQFE